MKSFYRNNQASCRSGNTSFYVCKLFDCSCVPKNRPMLQMNCF